MQRAAYEQLLLMDPKTGKVPERIRQRELQFASQMQDALPQLRSNETEPNWVERGPFNVGGRTRALAVDHTNPNVILAGAVSGGMWRSTDLGTSWERVSALEDWRSVTSIAQDPREGFEHVWYYSSGELTGNSAGASGAPYTGNGVYKSVDGGISWMQLEPTAVDPKDDYHTEFTYSWSIKVAPSGDVYLAGARGIQRSQDQGTSWGRVLPIPNYYVDMDISSTGVFYAVSPEGIYRSETGNKDEWNLINDENIDLTGWNRIVLDIAPSNEEKVYFFAHTPGKGVSSHSIFVYEHTKAEGERWEERSENLPAYGGNVGNLNQGSYNQYVFVKPDNENVVYIGSTNMYRSTDGFTSTNNNAWIGGYATSNDVSQYKNHHPDNHSIAFIPGNPNKMVSAHDGGISLTNNNLADQVEWESLNHGYTTTQSYTVAIDEKTAGDNRILIGLQDNGKWYSNTTDSKASWGEEIAGGDGAYVAIVPGKDLRYHSTQFGNVLASLGTDPEDPTGAYRVSPIFEEDFDGLHFINPFILDFNNENTMYYVTKEHMWVNSKLDKLAAGEQLDNRGWIRLDKTATSNTIIQVAGSKTVAGRIFYATLSGSELYRLDNATNPSSVPVKIGGNDFPDRGYLNSIAIDPTDDEKIMVCFTRYNIQSIFYTENGGTTWKAVGGNLEASVSGEGDGPSVQSVAIHSPEGGQASYFVGTSTGLYHTETLDGSNTVWVSQAEQVIGKAIISMIKTRADGLVVAATHGNGVYSAYYGTDDQPPMVAKSLKDVSIFEGDAAINLSIEGVFSDPDGDELAISVESSGDVIEVVLEGNVLKITPKENGGSQDVILTATANDKTVSETFVVDVNGISTSVIMSQWDGLQDSGYPSRDFAASSAATDVVILADDFTIEEGETWKMTDVLIGYFTLNENGIVPTQLNVTIYEDKNGKPGTIKRFDQTLAFSRLNSSVGYISFATPLELEAGTYWFSVNTEDMNGDEFYWRFNGTGSGRTFHAKYIDDGKEDFEWYAIEEEGETLHLSMLIYGVSEGDNTVEAPSELSGNYLSEKNISLQWVDQSSYELGFNIERATSKEGPFNVIGSVAKDFTQWTDRSINPTTQEIGDEYFYRLNAFDSKGASGYSNVEKVTIMTEPTAPELKEVDVLGGANLAFHFVDQSDNEDQFVLEYSLVGDRGFASAKTIESKEGAGTEYSFDYNSPIRGREIFFRVAAENSYGKAYSQVGQVVTTLESPTNVRIIGEGVDQLRVAWEDESSLETGFEVYISTNGENFIAAGISDVNAKELIVSGLDAETTYKVKVKAINGVSKSLFSNEVEGTTIAGIEFDLTQETNSNISVHMNWNDISGKIGVEQIRVNRKKEGEDNFEILSLLTKESTSYLDESVENGTAYSYRVELLNGDEVVIGYAEVNARTDYVLSSPNSKESVIAYPNPSKGTFNVSIPAGIQTQSIEVFDHTGRKVFVNNTSLHEITLNLNHLGAGIYTLVVKEANSYSAVRIVIH